MEPCAKKITRKNNPALVAAVFRLMFETLWIPPYDRRKCNALVVDFELCARSAVIRRPSGVPKLWKPYTAWLPACANGVPTRCECGDLLPVASGAMLR